MTVPNGEGVAPAAEASSPPPAAPTSTVESSATDSSTPVDRLASLWDIPKDSPLIPKAEPVVPPVELPAHAADYVPQGEAASEEDLLKLMGVQPPAAAAAPAAEPPAAGVAQAAEPPVPFDLSDDDYDAMFRDKNKFIETIRSITQDRQAFQAEVEAFRREREEFHNQVQGITSSDGFIAKLNEQIAGALEAKSLIDNVLREFPHIDPYPVTFENAFLAAQGKNPSGTREQWIRAAAEETNKVYLLDQNLRSSKRVDVRKPAAAPSGSAPPARSSAPAPVEDPSNAARRLGDMFFGGKI